MLHSWSPPWIPFRICWRSVTAVANDLILEEPDGKGHSFVGRTHLQVPSHRRLGLPHRTFRGNISIHLIVCTCAKSLQLYLTLCTWLLVDHSLPDSSVHGLVQARILEWVAVSSSRGSFQPRNWTHISCLLHWQVGSLPLAPRQKPSFHHTWLQSRGTVRDPPLDVLCTSVLSTLSWECSCTSVSVSSASTCSASVEKTNLGSKTLRKMGTSLAGQWLRLWAPTAGGVGLIPGCRTKIPQAARCGHPPPKKKKKNSRKFKKQNLNLPSSSRFGLPWQFSW